MDVCNINKWSRQKNQRKCFINILFYVSIKFMKRHGHYKRRIFSFFQTHYAFGFCSCPTINYCFAFIILFVMPRGMKLKKYKICSIFAYDLIIHLVYTNYVYTNYVISIENRLSQSAEIAIGKNLIAVYVFYIYYIQWWCSFLFNR